MMNKITSIPNSVPTVDKSKKSLQNWFAVTALIVLLVALLLLNGRVIATQTMASSKEVTQSFPLGYDATGAMLDAVVFPTYLDQRIQSPLAQYDATGSMLNAVVFPTYSDQRMTVPISQGLSYDATGAMLEAVVFPKYPK
jgi:uncharacterized lipoprotein YajG